MNRDAAVKPVCARCRKPGSKRDRIVKVGQYRLHRSHLATPTR